MEAPCQPKLQSDGVSHGLAFEQEVANAREVRTLSWLSRLLHKLLLAGLGGKPAWALPGICMLSGDGLIKLELPAPVHPVPGLIPVEGVAQDELRCHCCRMNRADQGFAKICHE